MTPVFKLALDTSKMPSERIECLDSYKGLAVGVSTLEDVMSLEEMNHHVIYSPQSKLLQEIFVIIKSDETVVLKFRSASKSLESITITNYI